MLFFLGRYKEALDLYRSIHDDEKQLPAGLFPTPPLSVPSLQDLEKYQDNDPLAWDPLYTMGRHEDALARANMGIAAAERFKQAPAAIGLYYVQRALSEAALGRLIPSLQDLDVALSPLRYSSAGWSYFADAYSKKAIILYLNGKSTEGEEACRKSLDYERSNAIEGLCARMKNAANHFK
jgi:hypothetical protein